MREQALEKPLFMREWAKTNRAIAQQFERDNRIWNVRRNRKIERRRRKQDEIRATNIKYVQDNRELVEGGHHWAWLVRFAELVLMAPDKIKHEVGDEALVRNALRNCLNFITPCVPDLIKLAELRCASRLLNSERILYAACLEIMRVKGNLEEVNLHLLRALRINIYTYTGYSAVSSEERGALFREVDRLIFPDSIAVVSSVRT